MESKYKYKIETDKEPTQFIVYKAIIPSERIYIGITSKSLGDRISEHAYTAFTLNKQYPMARSIRKYNIINIQWSIVDYANSWEDLCELEKYWIKELNTYINDEDSNGLNVTKGGEGAFDYKYTDEQLKKISISRKLYYKEHPEVLIEISIKFKKYYSNPNNIKVSTEKRKINFENNPEIRIKMSNSRKQHFLIRENREKASISQGGRSFSVYKKVVNEFIGKWISQTLCAKDLNLNQTKINQCLMNNNHESKGYIFIFDDENTEENLNDKLNYVKKTSKVFNVYKKEDNSFVMTSHNQHDCARILDIKNEGIYSCLNKRTKKHKGYLFYYLDDDPNLNVNKKSPSEKEVIFNAKSW